MTKKKWKTKITGCLKELDIMQESFGSFVDSISTILEERDCVFDKYCEDGRNPVITTTNTKGFENVVTNPLLIQWIKLNDQALQYWRELGLTPSSYKKIAGDKTKEEFSGLANVLSELDI